jgi:hypothetical protein
MINANILRSLVTAALLASACAHAAEKAIQVERRQGQPVAQFRIGDSHCILKDDAVQCTPAKK